MKTCKLLAASVMLASQCAWAGTEARLEAPRIVPCFDPAEFVVRIEQPKFQNPFTEVELGGEFVPPKGAAISVPGFCDAADGSLFRLRFCPDQPGATYRYTLQLRSASFAKVFKGELRCAPSDRPGPVVVDLEHPKHFMFAGSKTPFYHLGYTAYHLLDSSNDESQIQALIAWCATNGFNKIRFLLAGYPRDFDRRTSADVEQGVPDPWKAPNYGARPGQVNPLPAWLGKPHAYDFTRFNILYWQQVDRAVRQMRAHGIVATAIFTIEKQDLPAEYGRLTEHELRLYRYAVARLAAFDNVWWDLGNEHNEFRDIAWGNAMGTWLKAVDPCDRLASAHAYAEFAYWNSAWADFIITQQYGEPQNVHDWALRHLRVPKPYVNEEYGYEGSFDRPGHGMNADWVRRCHWAIALAGGYATYGDWSGGISYFYMGEPGPGRAAPQLRHLRTFFEALPFWQLEPHDELVQNGFCLAMPGKCYAFYFPRGGTCEVESVAELNLPLQTRWFDPRSGSWQKGPRLHPGLNKLTTPTEEDWALTANEAPAQTDQ